MFITLPITERCLRAPTQLLPRLLRDPTGLSHLLLYTSRDHVENKLLVSIFFGDLVNNTQKQLSYQLHLEMNTNIWLSRGGENRI